MSPQTYKPTVACEGHDCRQPSLVKMPDGSNLCEYHYSEWWQHNYLKVTPRVTHNPVCDAIRAEYQSRRAAKQKLSEMGDALAEKMAA